MMLKQRLFAVFLAVQFLTTGWARAEGELISPSAATAVAIEQKCIAQTDKGRARLQLGLSVLETFQRHEGMFDAAVGLFGLSDVQTECLSEEFKQRVSNATLKAGAWDYGFAGTKRLALAQQLGGRDQKIIEDVARVAFAPEPINDIASSDIRPEARSVLASFGQRAAQWRVQALKLTNAKDSLGTSAAQVAAASGDTQAVNVVADLIRVELMQTQGKAIPRKRAKLIVELAYAIGAAGEMGRPYAALLIEILNRDVESFAPPFGVIARPPTEICRALKRVGGADAEKALQGSRCSGKWFLLPS